MFRTVAIGLGVFLFLGLIFIQVGKTKTPRRLQNITTTISKSDSHSAFQTVDATDLTNKTLSPRQLAHARLYRETRPSGPDLDKIAQSRDWAASQDLGTLIRQPNLQPRDYFHTMGCKATVVIVGTIVKKESALNEGNTFVFTDYDLQVEQILKNDGNDPNLSVGSTVEISRGSGSVILHGHRIETIDRAHRPLAVGSKYLMFLQRIPDTGAYRPMMPAGSGDDTFLIAGDKATVVSEVPVPYEPGYKVNLSELMSLVTGGITAPCQN